MLILPAHVKEIGLCVCIGVRGGGEEGWGKGGVGRVGVISIAYLISFS